MMRMKYLVLLAPVLLLLGCGPSHVAVGFGVGYGAPPICPYGYFAYAPYNCAPYGYYGPEWFPNGVFIGAGPWFHGPRHFHGRIDRHYDVRHGYRGPLPRRGERPDRAHPPGHYQHFHGNHRQNGQGRAYHRF